MKKQACPSLPILILFLLFTLFWNIEAQQCMRSGTITGTKPPLNACNTDNDSDCCTEGEVYDTYTCSPALIGYTPAILTLNSFESGADGGGPSACDGKYHSDDTPIVALSTGWFNNKARCFNQITILGNGKIVPAVVVDECDSTVGCDAEHNYQPPCGANIVDGSKALWKALGVPEDNWGYMYIYWTYP